MQLNQYVNIDILVNMYRMAVVQTLFKTAFINCRVWLPKAQNPDDFLCGNRLTWSGGNVQLLGNSLQGLIVNDSSSVMLLFGQCRAILHSKLLLLNNAVHSLKGTHKHLISKGLYLESVSIFLPWLEDKYLPLKCCMHICKYIHLTYSTCVSIYMKMMMKCDVAFRMQLECP